MCGRRVRRHTRQRAQSLRIANSGRDLAATIDYNVHPVLVLTGGGDQVKAVSAHNARTYHIITTHNRLIMPVSLYLDKVEPY